MYNIFKIKFKPTKKQSKQQLHHKRPNYGQSEFFIIVLRDRENLRAMTLVNRGLKRLASSRTGQPTLPGLFGKEAFNVSGPRSRASTKGGLKASDASFFISAH